MAASDEVVRQTTNRAGTAGEQVGLRHQSGGFEVEYWIGRYVFWLVRAVLGRLCGEVYFQVVLDSPSELLSWRLDVIVYFSLQLHGSWAVAGMLSANAYGSFTLYTILFSQLLYTLASPTWTRCLPPNS